MKTRGEGHAKLDSHASQGRKLESTWFRNSERLGQPAAMRVGGSVQGAGRLSTGTGDRRTGDRNRRVESECLCRSVSALSRLLSFIMTLLCEDSPSVRARFIVKAPFNYSRDRGNLPYSNQSTKTG